MNMHSRVPALIPDHPTFATVAVRWVRHWNDQLFSFAVERPASFRFRSGEFVMMGLPGDPTGGSRPLMRAYSIASPAWAEEIEFLSIKVPDGPLTSRLQAIRPDDQLYLAKKPTGTLVLDALLGGSRLFLLSTGTGLAPFLSLARDPEIYDRFGQVLLAHSVRGVSDLAYHDMLTSQLAGDPLVGDQALLQFHYVPTVTRERFRTQGRIDALISDRRLFAPPLTGPRHFNPETDRIMLCGSTAMIRETAAMLDEMGFDEGSNAKPGRYVIERAFVG
jgi:ferredoxin--NADP+ reductase